MGEIVKVQRAIVPKDGPALIYDRRRRHEIATPLSPSVTKIMGDDYKLFFHAEWTGSTWIIGQQAPWQEW